MWRKTVKQDSLFLLERGDETGLCFGLNRVKYLGFAFDKKAFRDVKAPKKLTKSQAKLNSSHFELAASKGELIQTIDEIQDVSYIKKTK